MTDPDWEGYASRRMGIELPQPRPPRRARGPAVGACAALLLLCSMCLRSSWGGSAASELSAQERHEALTMPPSMVSEEKRRALVGRDYQEAEERVKRLLLVASEQSPAGEDARKALENLRATLGR